MGFVHAAGYPVVQQHLCYHWLRCRQPTEASRRRSEGVRAGRVLAHAHTRGGGLRKRGGTPNWAGLLLCAGTPRTSRPSLAVAPVARLVVGRGDQVSPARKILEIRPPGWHATLQQARAVRVALSIDSTIAVRHALVEAVAGVLRVGGARGAVRSHVLGARAAGQCPPPRASPVFHKRWHSANVEAGKHVGGGDKVGGEARERPCVFGTLRAARAHTGGWWQTWASCGTSGT